MLASSVGVETTCFEIKNGNFFPDQHRWFFEIFGSRPKPGIIKTGNYLTSKNESISPSLTNLFFQKVTMTFQVNEDF